MKLEKLFLPLSVLAAVIAVYVFFRGSGKPATVTIPSTASSGVPASYTSQGQVQPVSYNVPAVPVSPSPLIYLGQPNAAGNTTPPYMNFNLGPGNLLNNPPALPEAAPATCGCGGGCSTCANQCGQQAYPDGAGNTPMATSRKRQIVASQPSGWLPNAIQNLNSYLAMEGQEPSTPTLTSWIPGGAIQ